MIIFENETKSNNALLLSLTRLFLSCPTSQ